MPQPKRASELTNNTPKPCLPFLKWPGGKRWAAGQIAGLIRENLTGRYYEPFLGGGAVFFHLRPTKATLSDINPEVIAGYTAVRDLSEELSEALQRMSVSRARYRQVLASRPKGTAQRAIRLLYLNRTAFGGMYRLNQKGLFNVPYGGGERTPDILWRTQLLQHAAGALKGVTLRACDFASSMSHARTGDVVYCDPTYTVAHDKNGFVRYNERNFSWEDQERLAEAANAARDRGATVLISNAHHRSIRDLYKDTRAMVLTRTSRLSPVVTGRTTVNEYLLLLRPKRRPR